MNDDPIPGTTQSSSSAGDVGATPDGLFDARGAPNTNASGKSVDTMRLILAVGVLAVVALVAVAIGITRRSSPSAGGNAAATSTVTGTTAKAKPSGCATGSWPPLYLAKRDPATMTAMGAYVWNDNPGWKIRLVDPGGTTAYSGTITSGSTLDPKAFTMSPGAVGKVDVKANQATFELKGAPASTGVDFQIQCATTQISIAISVKGGAPLPVELISIGKNAKALSNPIAIAKQA